jgi:uncharacterized protein YndB with AHSA1/START domain
MVPDGMTSEIHQYDARVGGAFRVSLTYDDGGGTGKSGGHTDTYHGTFVDLVADTKVEQVVEFETSDPAMAGAMRVTYVLSDADGGTLVEGTHENVPPGVSAEDNELGWQMSMAKLAALVEGN